MSMYNYFVETCEPQPRFYVFSQIFEAERNINFKRNLNIFEKDYEINQEHSFLKFWSSNANSIVSEKYWLGNKNKKRSANSNETPIIWCDNSLGTDKCAEDNLFWQRYYEQVYLEQYQVYTLIFYEYYKHLYKSLETNDVEIEEVAENSQNQDLNNSIVSELEQLQLLGLPTAFGKQLRKKETTSKRNKKLQLFYNGFFSDEEEECLNVNTLSDSDLLMDRKKKKNRKIRNVPAFLLENKGMLKYWRKRFSLFSRYDEGIRLDCESWFSVTPEKIARHLAERLSCDIIIDAFCGCGGNAIQFARTCKRVVAIDIDPLKLNMAKHNATIYGVADRIDFVVGDFLQISSVAQFRSDAIFLSPPWGGPKYKKKTVYDIENYLQPAGASKLMEIAKTFSDNVALYLPRNAYIKQVVKLAGEGNRCEVEHNYLDSRLVAITAIYGESVIKSKVL